MVLKWCTEITWWFYRKMIIKEILKSAEEPLKGRTVEEIRIGLGYTAVKLDDGSAGLAATLHQEITGCCSLIERAGDLSGCPAHPMSELALSTDVLESAVGLATINASINKDIKSNTSAPIEALEISEDNIVGMVGYFEPLIEPIQQRCRQLYVFERKPPEREFVRPDWAVNVLLSECDIVIISGTTLLNKTIDHLLELCRGTIAILGPSTPLSPIFKNYGVSFLFGTVVRDTNKLLKIVSEGGGTRLFRETVEKINLKL
jgi:hypothetical protein